MKKMLTAAMGATIALSTSACQTTDPRTGETKISNTAKGAALGALAGAALGALTQTSDGKQAAKNAMIGAGIGALGGAAAGRYMDEQERKLRESMEGTGVEVERVGDRVNLNMPGDITFALGSSELSSSFYPVLGDMANVLQEYDQTIVSIDGHTDTSGSADLNQRLSEERADNVAAFILGQGVMPERFIVTGHGESLPKVATGDNVKEAANRRVEISIVPFTEETS